MSNAVQARVVDPTKPDNSAVRTITADPGHPAGSRRRLHRAVDGDCGPDGADHDDLRITFCVNEEGEIHNLPVDRLATELWWHYDRRASAYCSRGCTQLIYCKPSQSRRSYGGWLRPLHVHHAARTTAVSYTWLRRSGIACSLAPTYLRRVPGGTGAASGLTNNGWGYFTASLRCTTTLPRPPPLPATPASILVEQAVEPNPTTEYGPR